MAVPGWSLRTPFAFSPTERNDPSRTSQRPRVLSMQSKPFSPSRGFRAFDLDFRRKGNGGSRLAGAVHLIFISVFFRSSYPHPVHATPSRCTKQSWVQSIILGRYSHQPLKARCGGARRRGARPDASPRAALHVDAPLRWTKSTNFCWGGKRGNVNWEFPREQRWADVMIDRPPSCIGL